MSRSRGYVRRWLGDSVKKTKESTPKSSAAAAAPAAKKKTGWWHSAELWGGLGALAGWGMSGSAIYDAALKGPELISLTMTPVLIVYSSMFAYWSFIIIPKNYLLASCHIANVIAQSNQLRRGLEYKMESGQDEDVKKFYQTAAVGGSSSAAATTGVPPRSPPPARHPNLSVLLTYLYCRSCNSLKSKAVCRVTVS